MPTRPSSAGGPLIVSKTNPRYFTVRSGDGEGRAVYLTGSHIWNNLHDGMGAGSACVDPAERFDFDGYLAFLKERGHNFIRLWRWEHFSSQAAGGNYHLCMTPQPWRRTGPGTAKDGKPKFDLSTFDDAFFHRLRGRVIAAGNAGIYVGVLFFEGWALHLSPAPLHVEGHPFHGANNVNGVGIESIVDYQVLPLAPDVRLLQETYIKKVVDTVHDLPNVLYEVVNESSGDGEVDEEFARMLGQSGKPRWGNSTEWQYWVIDVVKEHERDKGYVPLPIGMTMQFPVANQTCVNTPLLESDAEWISPGYDDEIFAKGGHPMAPNSPPSRWYDDPPAADGKKVVITDTDHYAPGKGDALWAWKSFVRGHHPILMDFGLIDGVSPRAQRFAAFEPARYAMGDTLTYAKRMNLIAMTPRVDLASTRYALANVGKEYFVLQPDGAQPFDVMLAAGTYAVEWFAVNSRETECPDDLVVARDGTQRFEPPFTAQPAVLYLFRR
jgi:hypothetical protein